MEIWRGHWFCLDPKSVAPNDDHHDDDAWFEDDLCVKTSYCSTLLQVWLSKKASEVKDFVRNNNLHKVRLI